MRKGGQKAKANAHERSVAKIFTEVYYPAGDGEFRRIPLSGGWDKRAMPGDLVPLRYVDEEKKEMIIDKTFPMTVECKTWKDVKHFVSGLYSKESQFFDWMKQAWDDASLVNKIPVVVFKLYRQPNVAMLSELDFNKIAGLFGNFGDKLYALERIESRTIDFDGVDYQKLVFVLLRDFVEWIDWEIYKKDKEHKKDD